MSNYPHLLGRITNTPLMVAADYLSSALSVLSQRMDTPLLLPEMEQPFYTSRRAQGSRAIINGIATIGIDGSLAHKGGNIQGASTEMRSYQSIKRDIEAAMNDNQVKGIALDIDSPGGEVAGNFDLVRYIASQRGRKPMWSMINESATSAAYNIAAATDRIVGSPEINVGSIGVVTAHISKQQALQDKGIKVTFIHAGAHKVDGNQAEDLSDEVKADIQARINEVYRNFVSTVAENRGLQALDVQQTEARIYSGLEAKDRGLVDEIMSADEAFAAFCEHCNGASHINTTGNIMSGNTGVVEGAEAVETGPTYEDGLKEGRAAGIQEGVKADRERIMGILKLESANQSANHQVMALEYCEMGMSIEQADNLLSKQAVVKASEPPLQEPDALGEAMSRAKLDNEDVNATPESNLSDEDAELLASALQFKTDTASYARYAVGDSNVQ